MTPAAVISEARRLLHDAREPVRLSDVAFLGLVNQTLKRMAILRPDLFAAIVNHATVPGQVVQSAPADSLRIMEVFRVVGGGSITEVDREAMDESHPTWAADPAGPCVNWMRHPRNANRFFVYPSAPVGQSLQIEYAQSPRDYAMGGPVELLPAAHFPTVVDGVVYLASSFDDEHVNSNRAQMFQQAFVQALAVSLQTRVSTDAEHGGIGQAPAPR